MTIAMMLLTLSYQMKPIRKTNSLTVYKRQSEGHQKTTLKHFVKDIYFAQGESAPDV